MIRIIAQFNIKPENINEAVSLLSELVAETLKEKGCISYELLQDVASKELLIISEQWESQVALDKHSASHHFTTIVPKVAAMSEKEPIISIVNKLA